MRRRRPGLPIQYQEAVAHAGESYSFAPGGVVTVPFRPRPGDSTVVDGAAPVALPAGQGSTAAAPDLIAGPASATPSGTTNLLRREVFGFLPYWELGSTARLQHAFDDRLLRRRPQHRRYPQQVQQRLERLGQLDDDVGDQRRACPRHTRRADGPELRVGQRGSRRPDGRPLEPNGKPDRGPADRRRGRSPGGRRRRSGLRADRARSVGQLRQPSSGRCGPSWTGSTPATS